MNAVTRMGIVVVLATRLVGAKEIDRKYLLSMSLTMTVRP
jgi:hypothetical protein